MSRLTLIPFGLWTTDRRLVDVSKVPQDAGCSWICPSFQLVDICSYGDEYPVNYTEPGQHRVWVSLGCCEVFASEL